MMIVDAISTASTEHAVYFLVTSYIESLQHFPRGADLPECVVKLPLAGFDDLQARLTCLRSEIDSADVAVPSYEVSAVLASAVHRLANECAQSGEKR